METRDTRDTGNTLDPRAGRNAGGDPEPATAAGVTAAEAGATAAADGTSLGDATPAGAATCPSAVAAGSPDRASPGAARTGRAGQVRKPRPRRKPFVL